ncbi:hypothetical protein TIFTF001_012004 [Ficus carica]|uniref:Uncharacterized protein n=1 Tax=Ficus carica TaxID=3494 RepID=A0AA87ZZB1_FICCA|nr:hypothetical protein TIFTF001_012004 [Ficus carica]
MLLCRHKLRQGYRGSTVTICLHQLQRGAALPRSFDRGPRVGDPVAEVSILPDPEPTRASTFTGPQSSDHDLIPPILPSHQISGN